MVASLRVRPSVRPFPRDPDGESQRTDEKLADDHDLLHQPASQPLDPIPAALSLRRLALRSLVPAGPPFFSLHPMFALLSATKREALPAGLRLASTASSTGPLPYHLCSHLQNIARKRIAVTSIPYTPMNLGIASVLLRNGFISNLTRCVSAASLRAARRAALARSVAAQILGMLGVPRSEGPNWLVRRTNGRLERSRLPEQSRRPLSVLPPLRVLSPSRVSSSSQPGETPLACVRGRA